MREFFELFGLIIVVLIVLAVIALIVSLPFAFIGWVLLVVANLFTVIATTYFNSFMTGLCAVIIGGLVSK